MTVNIPNILTVMRLLLTPLFVIFLLKHLYASALLVFVIACISDSLDGILARFLNQKTAFGAYLDPIADKVLLITAFVSLAILKMIPGWLAVIVISRDILITIGISVFTISNIKYQVKPSVVSKCTTVLQSLTIIAALVNLVFSVSSLIMVSLYWATATFTVISGIHYLYIGLNLLQGVVHNENPPDS
jgi:cardiolipin synthase